MLALATLCITLVALFAVGEITCRLFWPDRRLRYEADPIALFRIAPSQNGYLALSDGTEVGPTAINQYGFRGPERPTGIQRSILLLGDSFTFGIGVNDAETFAARLGRALGPEVHIWNGGQPGYGLYQMQATFDRVADALRPERVTIVIWQGDFLRQPLAEPEKAALLRHRRVLSAWRSSALATQLYRRIERLALRLGMRGFAVVGETAPFAGSEATTAALRAGLEADLPRLRALHARARQIGAGLVVILWPNEDFGTSAESGLALLLSSELRRFAEAEEIPFFSLQSAFAAAEPDRLRIPNDWHPTAFAHCLVARRIAEDLALLGEPIAEPVRCDGDAPDRAR